MLDFIAVSSKSSGRRNNGLFETNVGLEVLSSVTIAIHAIGRLISLMFISERGIHEEGTAKDIDVAANLEIFPSIDVAALETWAISFLSIMLN